MAMPASSAPPPRPRATLTRAALAAEIGELAAARLIARWGGHQLPRRTGRVVSRETRDASILADLDAGHTYAETAARNRCSIATAWRVGKRVAPPAPRR